MFHEILAQAAATGLTGSTSAIEVGLAAGGAAIGIGAVGAGASQAVGRNPGAMGKTGAGMLFPLALFFLIFGLGACFG